ncbi:hypothetical protein PMAYCL1PPCAC_05637, partial [Pristionchus mayeri]
ILMKLKASFTWNLTHAAVVYGVVQGGVVQCKISDEELCSGANCNDQTKYGEDLKDSGNCLFLRLLRNDSGIL